jgi:two-component system nitrate/nitrite response regulator NarL
MHMQPTTTVLLISSPHLNWERLRALLAKQRHAQVVGEVHQCDEAVRHAVGEQPDVIIAGSDVPGVPIIVLVQELRDASPASRIVVVGKLLDSVCHRQLTDLGARGFLLWKDVTEETLWPLLEYSGPSAFASRCANGRATDTQHLPARSRL